MAGFQHSVKTCSNKAQHGRTPSACLWCGFDPMAKPPELTISVTRSAGDDRAVLVFIDTAFEPDSSDGGPGLRVLLNDNEAFVGKAYDLGADHQAKAVAFEVRLDEIPYTEEPS